jgi:hypothetical protein
MVAINCIKQPTKTGRVAGNEVLAAEARLAAIVEGAEFSRQPKSQWLRHVCESPASGNERRVRLRRCARDRQGNWRHRSGPLARLRLPSLWACRRPPRRHSVATLALPALRTTAYRSTNRCHRALPVQLPSLAVRVATDATVPAVATADQPGLSAPCSPRPGSLGEPTRRAEQTRQHDCASRLRIALSKVNLAHHLVPQCD